MSHLQDKNSTYSFTIHTDKKGSPLGDLFGIFFEDINRSADGGIYGELIENGAFEFDSRDNKTYSPLFAWEKAGDSKDVDLFIQDRDSVNSINPHYLRVKVKKAGSGVRNIGYNTGIHYEEKETYIFSCYAKTSTNNSITIQLCGKSGEVYGKQTLELSDTWEKHEIILESSHRDYEGRLEIIMEEEGEVCLDFTSLFPTNTFCNRKNGLRKDLAEAIADLKPKFMRFPGGCLVHRGTLCHEDRDTMYRWKNTLGKVEERPAKSCIWQYHQSLGLGYYEYFQFCEDIGTKAIPIIPAGFDPHTQDGAPLYKMQEWIDEALDLIEFATGDKESKWGKVRAQMGHPEPFELEYLGIGNEEQGEGFFTRYAIIHRAVKEKYPNIKLINSAGPFCEGGDYDSGWKSAREEQSEIIDEHYYQSPEWFIANHHRYDDFKTEDPKVFLGEYASEGNTWFHALAEASYMIGMERNADKVALACYAPLLANVDYVNWKLANLIWFHNHAVLLTPNYYIQKLFMNHQGDRQLLYTILGDDTLEDWTEDGEYTTGHITFKSNGANVEYKEIEIRDAHKQLIKQLDYLPIEKHSDEFYMSKVECQQYSISFKAKQLTEEGEGFLVHFGKKDDNNLMTLTLGGWNKANNLLIERINGKDSCLSQYPFPLEVGREYSVRIEIVGREVIITIDGAELQRMVRKHILVEPLYSSVSIEDKTGDVIFKVANLTAKTRDIEVVLKGNENYQRCKVFSMAGFDRDMENRIGEIPIVKPDEISLLINDNKLCYQIEPESFILFRISR